MWSGRWQITLPSSGPDCSREGTMDEDCILKSWTRPECYCIHLTLQGCRASSWHCWSKQLVHNTRPQNSSENISGLPQTCSRVERSWSHQGMGMSATCKGKSLTGGWNSSEWPPSNSQLLKQIFVMNPRHWCAIGDKGFRLEQHTPDSAVEYSYYSCFSLSWGEYSNKTDSTIVQ